jgi:type II secretory pathway pseudopilin PulG
MNHSKIKPRLVTAIIIGIIGSMAISLFSSIQQQSFAATAAEIEQKYLQDAREALQSNNTTGAIRDILAILEWEFNEVQPKLESFLGNVNVTASG